MRGSWNSDYHDYVLSSRSRSSKYSSRVEVERQKKQMVVGVGLVVVMLTIVGGGITVRKGKKANPFDNASCRRDEITPRFPADDSIHIPKSLIDRHYKHKPSSPTFDDWDVPFMPELNPIPEEEEEETFNDEHPSFGISPSQMREPPSGADLQEQISPSLNEFLPPSNSSITGGSSDYYKRHDSFRSVTSDPPVGLGSVADISSSADRYENFNSPVSDAVSTVKKVNSLNATKSPSPPRPSGQCLTFRPDCPPPQMDSESLSSIVGTSASRPKTPPKVAKLNFSFLEPPSPIPIRSTIALRPTTPDRGAKPTEKASDEKVPIDKQGLEDFLSVIGEKGLWCDLEEVENELSLTSAPQPVQELLRQMDVQKDVSLSYLCHGIDDETIFGEMIGNLAYLSAWEVNERRCARYSEKLNTALSRYSFDRLSYQVDLWTLNCEDREMIMNRISRLVDVRKRIASRASDRQWNRDFCGTQLSKDIIKMTLIYVRLYHKCLLDYKAALDGLKNDLVESAAVLDAEIRQEQSRDEIIQRWKETLNYYGETRQDMIRREDWLRARIADWRQQAEQVRNEVSNQQQIYKKEQQKTERLKQLNLNLNTFRERCLLVDEWALSKIKLDSNQHLVKLSFPTTPVIPCINPTLLTDASLSFDENAELVNNRTGNLRKTLLNKVYGSGMTVIDGFLAMVSPWELELRLKASPLPFVKGLRLANRDLTWERIYDKLSSENEISSKADMEALDASGPPKLFGNVLMLLGAATHDMLITTFKDLRQSASIDDLGGIAACLLNNAERLAVEIVALWHEFSAYNNQTLVFAEPSSSEPISTIFKCFLYRSSTAPKLTARIPVAVKTRVDVLTVRFDIYAAIQGGGLHAGFESVDGLTPEELSNVRLELKRKAKDMCYDCPVSVSAPNHIIPAEAVAFQRHGGCTIAPCLFSD